MATQQELQQYQQLRQIADRRKYGYDSMAARQNDNAKWTALGGDAAYNSLSSNPEIMAAYGTLPTKGDLAALVDTGGIGILGAAGAAAAGAGAIGGTAAAPAAGSDAALYAGTEVGAQTPLWGGPATYGTDIAATNAAEAAVGGGTLAGINGAAAGSGAGAGAGSAAGAAAGSRWQDYTPLVAPAIGYIGAKDIANQQEDLSNKYLAMGEPYRGRLAELYNNPEAFYDTQRADIEKNVQRGTDIMSRSLSMGGNPIGSGNALQQLQSYASEGMDAGLYGRLDAEKKNLANFGGLSSFNAAAPGAGQNAINANGNTWNAIGAGAETLSNIFNAPKKSGADLYWERRAKAEGY